MPVSRNLAIYVKGVKMAKTVILVDDSKTILATAQMAMEPLEQSGKVHMKTYLNPAELLEALDFKHKPILILTTESSAEMKAKGKAIGVTGWLVKPFSNEKLTKAVSMVLGL
jgi:two-component system chemotaxis response regulator CheY